MRSCSAGLPTFAAGGRLVAGWMTRVTSGPASGVASDTVCASRSMRGIDEPTPFLSAIGVGMHQDTK